MLFLNGFVHFDIHSAKKIDPIGLYQQPYFFMYKNEKVINKIFVDNFLSY